jgi:hypothetical protein
MTTFAEVCNWFIVRRPNEGMKMWGCQSSRHWHYVSVVVVLSVFKGYVTFIFKWNEGDISLKNVGKLSQWHSITRQRTRVLNYFTLEISKLANKNTLFYIIYFFGGSRILNSVMSAWWGGSVSGFYKWKHSMKKCIRFFYYLCIWGFQQLHCVIHMR